VHQQHNLVDEILRSQLFADVTLLSIAGKNLAGCLAKLNEDLQSLTKWLRFKKFKLNVSKTKLLPEGVFHDDLLIDNKPLEEVESNKY
jgi:hypothetical protein